MTDTILIVGAGVAGLTAAEQVAAAGAKAVVVERRPVVGGMLAAPMTRARAIGNRAEGQEIPLFDALSANDKIEILTNATLTGVDGRAGNFRATVTEKARFVTDACTRCKKCHNACPVVLPNEFDAGLTYRKAIYTPMIVTLPEAWVVDIDSCLNKPPNYLPCNRCREVCEDNAIHFDMPLESVHDIRAGALILAPGMRIESGEGYAELGYGAHPDVVTSAELQRLLEAPGPSGGVATRPSNEEYPESVLIVLDDPSPFGLYVAASQAKQLLQQDTGKVAVLVLSAPAGEDAAERLRETGIAVYWGAALQVRADEQGDIAVSFENLAEHGLVRDLFEMVVLCVDVGPPAGLERLATAAGIGLAPNGYLDVTGRNGSRVESSMPGIFVAGCGSGPKNIGESIEDARAAAAAALAQLNPMLLDGREDGPASQPKPQDDAMRMQLENLLHALLDR